MVDLMKLVVPEAVERQLLELSVLLVGEISDGIFSFLDVNGEGCLSKREGVGIRMASEAWMRREALHAVAEDVW
jgi:hypothetical protein